MSELTNNIAYLKGLAEGMKVSDKSDEGKLISKLIESLSDAAAELEAVSTHSKELEARVDSIEDEVYAVHTDIENLYDTIDDIDADDLDFFGDDYGDDEDDELFEIQCPECGEDVIVDFDMLDDENNIVCPNCHQDIELEFDADDEDDDDIL